MLFAKNDILHRFLNAQTLRVRSPRQKEKEHTFVYSFLFGDPDGNRTRVTAVKGRCLNRLTTGPYSEYRSPYWEAVGYGSGNRI